MRAPATALQVEVAASRGLDAKAASFLDGSTLEQLEAQADALVELLGTGQARREPEPVPAEDFFTIAAKAKAARKLEVARMFTGRARQPRDEAGRFTVAVGFDGGARPILPRPRSPEQEHNQVVSQLAWLGNTYRRGESF